MLAKRFWVIPRTVWKWGAKCGGERADVLDQHGQHLGSAAGLWFYGSPASCTAGVEAVTYKERRVCSSWEMELRATLEVTWNEAQASKSQHLPVPQRREQLL